MQANLCSTIPANNIRLIAEKQKNIKDIVKEEISHEKLMYQLEKDYANGKISEAEYKAGKLSIATAHDVKSKIDPTSSRQNKETRQIVKNEINHQKELYKLEQKYENGEISKGKYFKQKTILNLKHAVKNIFTGNICDTNTQIKNIAKQEINFCKNKMKLDNKLQKGEITKEEYAKKIAVLGFEHGLISSVTPNDSHAMYSTTA